MSFVDLLRALHEGSGLAADPTTLERFFAQAPRDLPLAQRNIGADLLRQSPQASTPDVLRAIQQATTREPGAAIRHGSPTPAAAPDPALLAEDVAAEGRRVLDKGYPQEAADWHMAQYRDLLSRAPQGAPPPPAESGLQELTVPRQEMPPTAPERAVEAPSPTTPPHSVDLAKFRHKYQQYAHDAYDDMVERGVPSAKAQAEVKDWLKAFREPAPIPESELPLLAREPGGFMTKLYSEYHPQLHPESYGEANVRRPDGPNPVRPEGIGRGEPTPEVLAGEGPQQPAGGVPVPGPVPPDAARAEGAAAEAAAGPPLGYGVPPAGPTQDRPLDLLFGQHPVEEGPDLPRPRAHQAEAPIPQGPHGLDREAMLTGERRDRAAREIRAYEQGLDTLGTSDETLRAPGQAHAVRTAEDIISDPTSGSLESLLNDLDSEQYGTSDLPHAAQPTPGQTATQDKLWAQRNARTRATAQAARDATAAMQGEGLDAQLPELDQGTYTRRLENDKATRRVSDAQMAERHALMRQNLQRKWDDNAPLTNEEIQLQKEARSEKTHEAAKARPAIPSAATTRYSTAATVLDRVQELELEHRGDFRQFWQALVTDPQLKPVLPDVSRYLLEVANLGDKSPHALNPAEHHLYQWYERVANEP